MYLLDLAVEGRKEAVELYDLVESLEGFAVEIRYPDPTLILTKDDARRAYSAAVAVKEKVGLLLAGDRD